MASDSQLDWQQAEFDPRDYLDAFFSGNLLAPNNKFTLNNLHNSFKGGELTGTLIDVGCGPTVHCLISASAYCDSITCSDYTPACRTQVEKWLKQDDVDFDWLSFFEFVTELEEKRTITEMQDDVRRNVKDVIHCDVRKPEVIPSSDKFDIVHCSLCLDDATNNKDDYLKCLNHVIGLLKPRGTLLLTVATNCRSYTIGATPRESANVSREDVIHFLTGIGFEIVHTAFMKFLVDIKSDETSPGEGGFLFIRSRSC